jgi:hypothetical protein
VPTRRRYRLHFPPFDRGSGLFINLGRTLVFNRYEQVKEWGKGSKLADGVNWFDNGWARKSADQGYDTLQINYGYLGGSEALLNVPACRTQPYAIGACFPPGVPVRTGFKANLQCNCSEYDFEGRPTTSVWNSSGGMSNCYGDLPSQRASAESDRRSRFTFGRHSG